MPEHLGPQDFNEEDLPGMRLTLATGEFLATPLNTTLFTHMGRLAMYDHVFLQTGEEDDNTVTGAYIFRISESFDAIADFMAQNDFPLVLNKMYAADCDINAYNTMVLNNTGDIGDFIPDDWT